MTLVSTRLTDFIGGEYGVIVADPPWQYQKAPGSKGEGRGANGVAEKHYGTMTTDEIAALPVAQIAAPVAHLFLWTTNPKMFGGRFSDLSARDIARAWGFEYKTLLTWVKTSRDGAIHGGGMGHFFRGATEHVLYATRGSAKIPSHLREPNVFLAPTSRHSGKPDVFMEKVERVTEGPYLELFCRTPRPGWSAWGNEVTDEEPRLSLADMLARRTRASR